MRSSQLPCRSRLFRHSGRFGLSLQASRVSRVLAFWVFSNVALQDRGLTRHLQATKAEPGLWGLAFRLFLVCPPPCTAPVEPPLSSLMYTWSVLHACLQTSRVSKEASQYYVQLRLQELPTPCTATFQLSLLYCAVFVFAPFFKAAFATSPLRSKYFYTSPLQHTQSSAC